MLRVEQADNGWAIYDGKLEAARTKTPYAAEIGLSQKGAKIHFALSLPRGLWPDPVVGDQSLQFVAVTKHAKLEITYLAHSDEGWRGTKWVFDTLPDLHRHPHRPAYVFDGDVQLTGQIEVINLEQTARKQPSSLSFQNDRGLEVMVHEAEALLAQTRREINELLK